MDEKYDIPVERSDLLFTVEMALRKAERLWPKKYVPGDHDRLKPVARAAGGTSGALPHALLPAGSGAPPQQHPGPLQDAAAERRQ